MHEIHCRASHAYPRAPRTARLLQHPAVADVSRAMWSFSSKSQARAPGRACTRPRHRRAPGKPGAPGHGRRTASTVPRICAVRACSLCMALCATRAACRAVAGGKI